MEIKSGTQNICSKASDEAYLYLGLGSTFAPVKDVTRHDHVFDSKLFGRKLAWAAFHHKQQPQASTDQGEDPTQEDEQNHRWSYPKTLAMAPTALQDRLGHPNQTRGLMP